MKASPSQAAIGAALKNVTATLGFIGKDCIVLASDSQTTTPLGIKLSARKVHRIAFKGDGAALVAIAGYVDGSDTFLDEFATLAAATDNDSPRAIATCAERAMGNTQVRVQGGIPKPFSKGDRAKQFEGNYCVVILGYYYGGSPFIFQLTLTAANSVLVTAPFLTNGSGSLAVGPVLDDFKTANLGRYEAAGLAVYSIGVAKRAELHCSGAVQVGIADKNGKCHLLTAGAVTALESASSRVSEKIKQIITSEISREFRTVEISEDDLF